MASGYAALGANILFTLIQWPLAVRYLSTKEFGLWTAVVSLSVNLQMLVDMGISGSIGRILIDHKDDSDSTYYGSTIKTGALALLAQGALIALVGSAITLGLPRWMNIDERFHEIFRHLMTGQCVLMGLAFVGRMNTFLLQAHQRYDVANYSQMGSLIASLVGLWIGFERGYGLYSLLLSTAVSLIVNNLCCLGAVVGLGLFPKADRWGVASWQKFKEIFSYANDIFLLSVAQVLIAMSQTPLITLRLGLEANAVWSTMTKTFMLAQQFIARMFDYSSTPFAEMMVRNERERLHARFRDVVLLTGSLGVFLCVGLVVGNASFVQLWMHGQFSWPVANDFLMALFILSYTSTRCHIGFAGLTKQIGIMKFIYLGEGVVFILLGYVLAPLLGLAGIIIAGILANLFCSGLYGLNRTRGYFSIPAREVLFDWLKFPARLFACLLIVAAALWFGTRQLPPVVRLVLDAAGYGLLGSFLLWRLGLPESLRQELGKFIARFRNRAENSR